MASNDPNVAETWDDEQPQQQQSNPVPQVSKLSLSAGAGEFKPSVKASAFVPRWNQPPPQQTMQQAPPEDYIPPQRQGPPPAPAKVLVIGGAKEEPKKAAPEPKVEPSTPKNANINASASTIANGKPSSTPASNKATPKSSTAATPERGPTPAPTPEKTDPSAVAAEIEENVDDETLEDLYGKEHINVVFIGHVDAGKSTMGGNILFITGMVDKRTMEKYEKEAKEQNRESWYLSWALDSTPQERAKGKTVEVGRAYFETDRRRYTILDAPGHKNFVPSMIGGAAQADIAVLVISARKGEFETGFERGGQTREHAVLAKTAGVNRLVVVINKMDDPTVEWSKERYDECVSKLSPFLKGAGYNPKTDIEWIPVSGYTGANLKERVGKKICPWFEGPSLLEYLDNMETIDRKVKAPLMMPISEKYKDMGTIVVGKIESGRVRKGMSVLVMPNKTPVEVTAIYNEMEDEVDGAICGDNVRVRLRGVEEEDVLVGFVLCDAKRPVKNVTHFEAQLAILEHRNIICAGYSAVMHVHTAVEEVTLSALLHKFDKKTNRRSKKPPQFARKGMKIIALIEAAQPICVETFEDTPQLGRFTLRDEGKTIAIGKITKLMEESQMHEAAAAVGAEIVTAE